MNDRNDLHQELENTLQEGKYRLVMADAWEQLQDNPWTFGPAATHALCNDVVWRLYFEPETVTREQYLFYVTHDWRNEHGEDLAAEAVHMANAMSDEAFQAFKRMTIKHNIEVNYITQMETHDEYRRWQRFVLDHMPFDDQEAGVLA